MASAIIAIVALILKKTSAHGLDAFEPRTNGYCKQLDIPVFATAESAIYDLPRPHGPQRLIQNTNTSGTFNIHAQLCVPKTESDKSDILQIATHGVHYDSRYWDPELDRDNLSYVEASLKAGYSILTYDRLGVGKSDIPDAYEVVQAPLELELLRQLTLMARNGTLYDFAKGGKRGKSRSPFAKLTKPSKVVHVGHSWGSVLTSAFIAKYGALTDGAIITGYLFGPYLGKSGMASFNAEAPASSTPSFDRPSGYVVCKKSGIQTIFFAGDTETAFTEEQLDYGNELKQPYMLAEFDFYICAGDCKGLANQTALEETYPNASVIDVAIQPNTGHAFTLHNNATAGYQVTFDFWIAMASKSVSGL
ncbi:unnamed protein product [Parascedosporium putredinis]|uniref:AB hydrolase-1 domain-containing protein n=1 Tax=Parascedosporium putredinis TaxID=1442378 RepID=A0A9P1HCP4_9PEZI|nr:unnamed protein product [Parascedosporium putredinis]CAI8005051.1 unnamed protein product [Parascedosporium putredinis]